jgi:hypothetical protein
VRQASATDLERAFEQAARGGAAGTPADALTRSVRRVLDLRREGLAAEPCPPAVLQRLSGWLAARPRGVAERLLALVFDSGTATVPALRGGATAPRTLRFAAGGAKVDVQVRPTPSRERVLHVAVQPAVPGLSVEVGTPRGRPGKGASRRRGTGRHATLSPVGTGELRIGAATSRVDLRFRLGKVETFRIQGVPLT